jgi:hypothetical protein
MNLVRTLLAKWDSVPGRTLLWANLALGLFAGLTNGGALIAALAKPTPGSEGVLSEVVYILPLAGVVALSAAFGLVQRTRERQVLALQGLVFIAGAAAELIWALSLLIGGIPAGNFVWSVGFFTASIAYAAFLLSRYVVPIGLRSMPAFYYAPAFALAAAAPVDLGVFVRVARNFF